MLCQGITGVSWRKRKRKSFAGSLCKKQEGKRLRHIQGNEITEHEVEGSSGGRQRWTGQSHSRSVLHLEQREGSEEILAGDSGKLGQAVGVEENRA